jgi:hypothetical protein
MEEEYCRRKLSTSRQPGSKEENHEGARVNTYPLKACSPVTYFTTRLYLQHFHHLPIVYATFESINGLMHSLGQNPHDLILSGNALTDIHRLCFTNLLGISHSNPIDNSD